MSAHTSFTESNVACLMFALQPFVFALDDVCLEFRHTLIYIQPEITIPITPNQVHKNTVTLGLGFNHTRDLVP